MFVLFILAYFSIAGANDCIPRDFGHSSIVCVCNSTYCDGTPEATLDPGSFLWYTSSKAGLRMELNTGRIGNNNSASTILTLNPQNRYQNIDGFGGAFTDAAGINIRNLSTEAQEKLLQTYFDEEGSRYNLGRIPIASTDFSTRFYTYDDTVNDTLLRNFSLAKEDFEYKIPLIQKAFQMNPKLRFLSAAWTPPVWMKTNNQHNGYGFLKTEFYQLYADYLLRFLDEYRKHDIDMWAISTGNEPSNAYLPFLRISSLGWIPENLGTWISNNLGPSLADSQHNQTMILTLDDQRFNLPWYVEKLFKNELAEKYVSGIALHWYWDMVVPASVLDDTHNDFPDKFLLMTEACEGAYPWQVPKVALGDWGRAESHVLKICQNLNHWSTGWVDWNLALDKEGGPNWIENFVDSPIIVNPETDEFFKQPMYYAIHHFSRFIPRGSTRIDLTINKNPTPLTHIAFDTPRNKTVVVIYNSDRSSQEVDIVDSRTGIINLALPALSINTIVY